MDDLSRLRNDHYNATLLDLRPCHPDLAIFRIRPDHPHLNWTPGQFTLLGLGGWEPRLPGTQSEPRDESHQHQLIRRAYSISAPILDRSGHVVSPAGDPVLEFYITLIRHNPVTPPALTPRLFCLRPGDRLFLGDKFTGHYTLAPVQPHHAVLFFATGTGEAPHNAMLAELLARGHRGPIVNAVCVRSRADLGYLDTHHRLEAMFPQYRYLIATTREPENLDPSVSGYVGKMYLQDLLRTGAIERALGTPLVPEDSHAFLCGNPQMIGIPELDSEHHRAYPEPTGMVELLEQRGFRCGDRDSPGNIHFEKYW